jgi:hypothetical protein
VMATMHFTGSGIGRQCRAAQRIVGATHAATGTGGSCLTNCHD